MDVDIKKALNAVCWVTRRKGFRSNCWLDLHADVLESRIILHDPSASDRDVDLSKPLHDYLEASLNGLLGRYIAGDPDEFEALPLQATVLCTLLSAPQDIYQRQEIPTDGKESQLLSGVLGLRLLQIEDHDGCAATVTVSSNQMMDSKPLTIEQMLYKIQSLVRAQRQ